MKTDAQRIITEQENAAYWAEQARLARMQCEIATKAGHLNIARHFWGHAVAAQDYAACSAAMARYHAGLEYLPSLT